MVGYVSEFQIARPLTGEGGQTDTRRCPETGPPPREPSKPIIDPMDFLSMNVLSIELRESSPISDIHYTNRTSKSKKTLQS